MENTDNFFKHIAQTSPSPLGLEVERAEGIYLHTPDGRRVADLISGVSVSAVGHSNPRVVEVVQRQAAEYMHTMVYGETVQAPQVKYAERLAELLPPELQSAYFVNSGAEAIEGAMKLAKRATGRREILAFRRAYHGSTHGALSLMSSPEGDEWRAPFEPLLADVDWLTFNDFSGLGRITSRTACVVVEPVQGEAGVRLPAEGFLNALRERCDEVGALLVFDEIQTGMGRTGGNAHGGLAKTSSLIPSSGSEFKHRGVGLFAFEKYGVVPDVLCLAKAFGGGMPLGAFISSREIMNTLSHSPALGHITTFGGNPVCCAAGLAALECILDESLLDLVETKGALFEQLLKGHPAVSEIRRAGLLLAVELRITNLRQAESSRARSQCRGANANLEENYELRIEQFMQNLLSHGILSDWFLFCDTAFRISPPLTITEEEIRTTCDTIINCLNEL